MQGVCCEEWCCVVKGCNKQLFDGDFVLAIRVESKRIPGYTDSYKDIEECRLTISKHETWYCGRDNNIYWVHYCKNCAVKMGLSW